VDERHSEGDEKERATAQIMDSDTLSLSLSLSLCFISMVHTRRPGARLYTGRGGQKQREKGVDRWGWSVWGDKGIRCFNSGAGPGTNWIW